MRNFVRKTLKFLGYAFFCLCLILVGIYFYLWAQTGKPAVERLIFKKTNSRPLVFAHRGGGGLFPENTLGAFEYSAKLGADVLELDIHATQDGKIVVLHDSTVNRTTDGQGKVSDFTFDELRKLDAGFNFSADNNQTFPFRGKDIPIPTLEEIFDAFPDKTFNIEPKQSSPSIVKNFCSILRNKKMTEKVIVGSFRQEVLDEFRIECPEVATSASPSEVTSFLTYQKTGLSESYSPPMQALQVPEYIGNLQVVTKDFVESAHKMNLKVHVWTVNETEDMKRLLALGVDGIMTDYPDRLLDLLNKTIIIEKSNK